MPTLQDAPSRANTDDLTDQVIQHRLDVIGIFDWIVETVVRVKELAAAIAGNGVEIVSGALRIKLAAGSALLLSAAGLAVDISSIHGVGDVKPSFNPTPAAGWINGSQGGSVGSVASGATNRAHADTQPLYELIWTITSANPSLAQIQDSAGVNTTRGASAAADFAANKRLMLPPLPGRALAFAGSGAGLTARGVAEAWGAETRPIGSGNLPAAGVAYNDNQVDTASYTLTAIGFLAGGGGTQDFGQFSAGPHAVTLNKSDLGRTTSNLGSGTALDINAPRIALYGHIKL